LRRGSSKLDLVIILPNATLDVGVAFISECIFPGI
jgi:hypothetical protein